MKNYIYIQGKKIPISDETAKEIAESFKEKEKELKSFEDCWNKVIKHTTSYYLSTTGNIHDSCLDEEDHIAFPNVPRRELARKVQLYIKLLTVAEAVNDGWTFDDKPDEDYSYTCLSSNGELCVRDYANIKAGDIKFKDRDTAKRAIGICPELWEEYLSID